MAFCIRWLAIFVTPMSVVDYEVVPDVEILDETAMVCSSSTDHQISDRFGDGLVLRHRPPVVPSRILPRVITAHKLSIRHVKKKKNIREHLTMKTKDLHKPNEHKPGLCTLMETMNACLLTKRREKTTKIAEKGFMFLTEDLANGGSGFS